MKHNSVLTDELVNKLNIKENGIYVDCTLGLGGHTLEIAKRCSKGKIIAIEQDEQALIEAKKRLQKFTNITYIHGNFREIDKFLKELGISKVDGIIYDLGVSYYQLTDPSRGFTYHGENIRLDMRMDTKQEISAITFLNEYSLEQIDKALRIYGDEKRSLKISSKIIEERKNNPITTNTQLNKVIKEVKGFDKKKHPSKNIYQAIRIEVNNEIEALEISLKKSLEILNKDGKMCVITFHSLEDRVVKNIFYEYKSKTLLTPMEDIKFFRTQKTKYPTEQEVLENRSSRSAKLRTITKIGEPNYER